MARSSLRRGFTLAEILIAIVILGVIGAAATRMLMVQSRFFDLQYAKRAARASSRSSMQVLLSDLQMVQDSGGVDSLASKYIRIRVPYRFGMVCSSTAATMTVSMLPVDSAIYAQASYVGYAYRGKTTGRYTYVTGTASPISSVLPALCTGSAVGDAHIQTFSYNGRSGANLDLTPGSTSATALEPVFLWQHISYYFATSTAYPGYYGLYRKVQGGNTDEIMAPFDTSAKFRIYKIAETSSANDTSLVTFSLADTSNVVGVDVVLPGKSTNSMVWYSARVDTMVTSVFFKNTRAF